jgi:DNA repair exonuclease SbcCD ATPase subunit
MTNYRIFADVELDMSGLKLTSIIGQWASDTKKSNGAGKSYLLESIPFALFGTNRSKKVKDVIKRGEKAAEVELHFKLDGSEFRVVRRVGVTSSVKVWIDGKSAATKSGDADEVLKQHLGVDEDLFELMIGRSI